MSRVLRVIGSLLVGLGFLVALSPFISTARIADVILDELPETVSGSSTDEQDRFGTAIFDEDFTLATRTFDTATVEEVEQALAAAGYQRISSGEDLVWSRECCGSWDAARVRVIEDDAQRAVAVMTVFDSDIQISWPFLSVLGLVPGLAGLILLARNPRHSSDRDADPDGQATDTADVVAAAD